MTRDKVILEATRYMTLREISNEGFITYAMWQRYSGATRKGERKCVKCGLVQDEKAQFNNSWSMSCLSCEVSDSMRYSKAKKRLMELKKERDNV